MMLLDKYPDEIVADFHQFYGLRFEKEVKKYPKRTMKLIMDLPPESRVLKSESPALNWSQETYMMRSMEHTLRVLAWQKTKDGQNNKNVPKPIEAIWEKEEKKIVDTSQYFSSTDTAELDAIFKRKVVPIDEEKEALKAN